MKFNKILSSIFLIFLISCASVAPTPTATPVPTATPLPSPTPTLSPTPIPAIDSTTIANTFLFPCSREEGPMPIPLKAETAIVLRGKFKGMGIVSEFDGKANACAMVPLRDLGIQADSLIELPSSEFSSINYGNALESISPGNAKYLGTVLTIGRGIIENMSFSPDGNFLVVTTPFGVNLYDGKSFELVKSIEKLVRFIGFSPDGKFLYTVSDAVEDKKTVHVWNLVDFSMEQTLHLNTTSIKSFSVSPDGAQFLTAGESGAILWNAHTGQLEKKLSSKKTATVSAFSNNGEFIVIGIEGKILLYKVDESPLFLWEADFMGRMGQVDRTFTDEPAIPEKIFFSGDGTTFNVLGRLEYGNQTFNYIYQIDTGEGKPAWRLSTDSPDGNLSISDGLEKIFVAEEIEEEWKYTSLELDEEFQGTLLSFSISPDNKKLAVATWGGKILIWDLEAYALQTKIEEYSSRIVNLDINKDGGMIAFAAIPRGNEERGLEIYLWQTWEQSANLLPEENYGFVFDIKFFPDKPILTTAVYDEDWRRRQVHVYYWSTENNEIIETYTHSSLSGGMISIASDGSRMAVNVGPETNRVYVWDVGRTNQTILERRTYFPGALPNSISADGALLAYEVINNGERQINVDSITDKKEILSINDTIGSFQFVPNSKKLIIATYQANGPELQIWDTNTSSKQRSFKLEALHPGVDIAISPDGQLVALVDFSNNIKVYAIGDTFSLVATLSGHQKQINEIAFSQDGRFLVSGGEDGTIKMWAVMP